MKLVTEMRLQIGLAAVCGVLVLAILTVNRSRLAHVRNQRERVAEVVRGGYRLHALTYEYLQTPGERVRAQWHLQYRALSELANGLERVTADPAELCANLHRARTSVETAFTDLCMLTERGDPAAADGGLDAAVRTARNERYGGEVLIRCRELLSLAFRLDAALAVRLQTAQEWAERLVLVCIAGLAIVTFGSYLVTVRRVSAKFQELHRGTEAVRGGDLDHRIASASSDEFGLLGRAFDRMTVALKTSRTMLKEEIQERRDAEVRWRATAAELAQSNHELEQLAFVVCHDLQEPLRAVSGYLQLLHQRHHEALDSSAVVYLKRAISAADHMHVMIVDLLNYSRTGWQRVVPQTIKAEEALEEALANLAPALAESRAQVIARDLPLVAVDRTQFVRLLQNLLSNAIKFRNNESPQVDVTAMRSDAFWLFSVSDNGIGIDPKDAGRIFGLFQRLTRDEGFAGTGIGLAVCRKIVELHGGRIWVEPNHPRGSVFRFTIPVGESPGGTPRSDAAPLPHNPPLASASPSVAGDL